MFKKVILSEEKKKMRRNKVDFFLIFSDLFNFLFNGDI